MKDPRFDKYGKTGSGIKSGLCICASQYYHLGPVGVMAIVLPHGVLFRGAAEGVIRKNLIEKNFLDAVIGLPANLFYGTSIPTTVLVFKKNRKNKGYFIL